MADALDHLQRAKDLIELVKMTCRDRTDDDANAVAAGLDAALAHLSRAEEALQVSA